MGKKSVPQSLKSLILILNRYRSPSSISSGDYSYALDFRQAYLKEGLRAQPATAEKAWRPPTPNNIKIKLSFSLIIPSIIRASFLFKNYR
jgi:hypothetical protein